MTPEIAHRNSELAAWQTATCLHRQNLILALIIAGLIGVMVLCSSAVICIVTRNTIFVLPDGQRSKPSPVLPAIRDHRAATLSTNAATAGECPTIIASAHRSADPASRGPLVERPQAGASISNQLAGARFVASARWTMPGESNTAPHIAYAAGQLSNFPSHPYKRPGAAEFVRTSPVAASPDQTEEAGANIFQAKTALSFAFAPFGPVYGRAGGDFAPAGACNGRATAARHGVKPHNSTPASAPWRTAQAISA